MKGQKLPREHHLVRLVPHGRLERDENDNPIGISYTAFQRRPDEGGLSATWLEYFAGDRTQRIERAARAFRASNFKPSKKAGFAVGNIGAIADACESRGHHVRIIHWPEPDNKAHAEVRQIPRDDELLLDELARGAWSELVLNASLPEGAEAAPDEPAQGAPDSDPTPGGNQ